MTKMRSKDPGEDWVSAYMIRPLAWLAYQFSSEARWLRKQRRRQPTANTGPWPSLPPADPERSNR